MFEVNDPDRTLRARLTNSVSLYRLARLPHGVNVGGDDGTTAPYLLYSD